MEFEEAKKKLIKIFIKLNFEVKNEEKGEIVFSKGSANVKLTKENIENYIQSYEFISKLQNIPVESSICGLDYREQKVEFITPRMLRRPYLRQDSIIFGDKLSGKPYVEIGAATNDYVTFFLDNEVLIKNFVRPYLRSENLFESFYKPLTIRIFNMNKTNIEDAIIYSNSKFEACLYELSYTNNYSLYITDEISRVSRVNTFSIKESISLRENRKFPSIHYNSDIIRFYQRGVGTDIPSLKFLAFYQVLEYFYVKVSDRKLHERMSLIINDPLFKFTSSSSYDKLIQEIGSHKKKILDEKQKLKLVLEEYVNEDDLTEFLKAYQEFLDEKYLNEQRDIFGEKISLSIKSGHVFGNVAKLVKTIRNALVHSSDSYGQQERHIPFSESTEIVKKEIPLVKFLAENVIKQFAAKKTLEV